MPWEVIRCLQLRPTHAQEGKKGVTSVYPGHSDSPEKPTHGLGFWQYAHLALGTPRLGPWAADPMSLEHSPAW